jgi:hypothetical protein
MCSVFWKIIQSQKRPVHFLFISRSVNVESTKTETITSESPLWALRTNIAISSYTMLKVSLSLLYVKLNLARWFVYCMVFPLARTRLLATDGSSLDTILSRLAKNTSTQVFKPVKPSGQFVHHQV